MYEICYNFKEDTTIYTSHSPSSGELLFDKHLEHEKTKTYNLMSNVAEIFPKKYVEFSQWKDFYHRVSTISSSSRQYLLTYLPSTIIWKNPHHTKNFKTSEFFSTHYHPSPCQILPNFKIDPYTRVFENRGENKE